MKEDKKPLEIEAQVKEKIGFATILYDRIYVITQAFDSTDKIRIREALHTGFDTLSPYLDSQSKTILKKKIKELNKISDKEDFLEEAHAIHRKLLAAFKKKDFLVREIPTSLG